MDNTSKQAWRWALGLALAAALVAGMIPQAAKAAAVRAEFYVGCYDVGQMALEKLPGVSRVTVGYRQGKETNGVYYDDQKITLQKMIKALKKAGTYKGLADGPSKVQ